MQIPRDQAEYHDAARWVLAEALETDKGDALLVIHDEHTSQVADHLVHVAERHIGADPTRHLVLSTEQAALSISNDIPRGLRARISHSSRVILLQKRAPELNNFRHNVLEYSTGRGRRAASMPGITLEYFHLCKGDLASISERCRRVAAVMLRSASGRIQSRTLDGDTLELDIPLGDYKPIESTGRIEPGSWGNVPSGETFIVPNLGTATGQVAINGSIVNRPLKGNEELVLELAEGRCRRVFSFKGELSPHIEALLFAADGRETYPNCSVLSELGVGTNAALSELTGLPIFDEKVLGTAHVGLGRSTQFGGPTRSAVHNDYVIRAPTLFLGGVVVVDQGRFALTEETAYPHWSRIQVGSHAYRTVTLGSQLPVIADEGVGQLYVTWISPRSSELQKVRVGDAETSEIAAKVFSNLHKNRDTPIAELAQRLDPPASGPALLPVLELLRQLRLVSLR